LGERVPGRWRCRWVEVLHCPKERIWRQRWGWGCWWRFWEGDWRWSWRCMGTSFHSRVLRRLWECQIQIARRRQRKRRRKERGWWKEKPWLKLKLKLTQDPKLKKCLRRGCLFILELNYIYFILLSESIDPNSFITLIFFGCIFLCFACMFAICQNRFRP